MQKRYDFKKARRGPVVRAKGKSRITIYLDDEIIERFRNLADISGSGYQTLINEALRECQGKSSGPIHE